ncbi:MAG: heavy-metal-associated domain-containing protein [Clostridiales bacterium]|nr:copper resistance protein CopZ [Clostridiales bacterium]MDD6107080.1 heavy-metal-associated domain-containing protein [Clostridiales bacterium]MDD6935315.1 heavy-metal-associated domain-containing protein [Clostridiales bacterium]MDY2960954.1 heavy-metal-associated domain-containing protein [Oscillospiraceae bacterium]
MRKITLKIDGMQCGMCEAHVNDAVRGAFPVKKVTSSHSKGETVILAEQEIDERTLRDVIGRTGYEVCSVSSEPYEKRGLFSGLRT